MSSRTASDQDYLISSPDWGSEYYAQSTAHLALMLEFCSRLKVGCIRLLEEECEPLDSIVRIDKQCPSPALITVLMVLLGSR